MADLAERRDPHARAARDRLGNMLGIHPRELAALDAQLALTIARHLNQSNRRIQRLVDQGTVDELTGALRRSAGLEALEREVQRARRAGDQRLVVAFVDVDDLKSVNDGAGHAAGDRLLRDVALTLRSRLRAYDLVMRWGGDEFVCVLPDAGLKGASRLLDQVAADFTTTSGRAFSVGFAELREGENAAELVARADAELYARRRCRRARGPRRPISTPAQRRLLVATGALAALLAALVTGSMVGSAAPGTPPRGPQAGRRGAGRDLDPPGTGQAARISSG